MTALAVMLSLLATPGVAAPSSAGAEPRSNVEPRDLPGLASPPAPKVTPPVPERLLHGLGDVAPHPSELAELNRRDKPSAFDCCRTH